MSKRSTTRRFLRWALPRLGKDPAGFRKPISQVESRIHDRIAELALGGLDDYRDYLESHPDEWATLDFLTRVTISRFYRNRGTWDFLRETALPHLAEAARARGDDRLRAWSAGCASGEEPYTLRLCWEFDVGGRFDDLDLEVVASDVDPHMLERAQAAEYPSGNLKELPAEWRDAAFESTATEAGEWRLRDEFRDDVEWRREDITESTPPGPFDIVFASYSVFIYYDEERSLRFAEQIHDLLVEDGVLVVGAHEEPPPGLFEAWLDRDVWRKARG